MLILLFRVPYIRTMTMRTTRIIITTRAFSLAACRIHKLAGLTSACGIRDDHSDGSVFYRYSDGSEYCRRKNGNITFRLSANSPNKVEGEDPTVAPASTATGRIRQPWIDWPPRLKLSIKTEGSSVVIRDDSGLTVTFEPVGSQVEVDPVPAYDRSASYLDLYKP